MSLSHPLTIPSPLKPTLLSLPPELLLQILTHLLSSTSLYALSATSHSLNTFLHLHAATITNSLITKYHSIPAEILGAKHIDSSGRWLVPTSEFVEKEEKALERGVILRSGCKCEGCRCIVRSGVMVKGRDEDEVVDDFGTGSESEGERLVSCLPTLAMKKTRGRECKAKMAVDEMVRLTEPGPLFLVFLERYGWEVEARWDIYVKSSLVRVKEGKQEEEVMGQDGYGAEGQGEDKTEVEAKKNERLKLFEFMIGNYCVRRFLEDVQKEIRGFRELSQVRAEDGQRMFLKDKVRPMLKLKDGCKTKAEVAKGKKKVKVQMRPAPRMFGEIEKSPDTAVVEKYTWVKGLLWYYGLKADSAVEDPVIGSTKASKTLFKVKARTCAAGVEKGIMNIGARMKGIIRHLHCVAQFQVLDD